MAETIPIRPRRGRPAPAIPAVRAVKIPAASAHLSKEARAMWREITGEWVLGVDALGILKSALEAWDVAQKCREEVARDGMTFRSETGQIRAHPAVKIGLDHAKEYRMAMRQLGLQPEEQ